MDAAERYENAIGARALDHAMQLLAPEFMARSVDVCDAEEAVPTDKRVGQTLVEYRKVSLGHAAPGSVRAASRSSSTARLEMAAKMPEAWSG